MKTSLFNTQQAAEYLNVSMAFLERDRWAGATIPFIKIGSRAVRYRQKDLEDFLESRICLNTCGRGVSL